MRNIFKMPDPADTKTTDNGDSDVIEAGERVNILVELGKLSAQGTRTERVVQELKIAVEDVVDEVLDLKQGFKKMGNSVATNRAVDDTQNREIAQIKQKMTLGEKAQVGGVFGAIILILEMLRGLGVGEWLSAMAKGTGNG